MIDFTQFRSGLIGGWMLMLGLASGLAASEAETDSMPVGASTLRERIDPDRLKVVAEHIEFIAGVRKDLIPLPGLTDFRAVIGLEAADVGGDRFVNRGEAIVKAAKKAGVDVVFETYPASKELDLLKDGRRGLKEGVLFIPGTSVRGLLVFPTRPLDQVSDATDEEFIKIATERDGLAFISNIEPNTEILQYGPTGIQIFRAGYDQRMDDILAGVMTDSKLLGKLKKTLKRYPEALVSAPLDYPNDRMVPWNARMKKWISVAVGGLDARADRPYVLKMADQNTVLFGREGQSDDRMRKLTAADHPKIPKLTKRKKPGDVLAQLDGAPLAQLFTSVNTHILAKSLTEWDIRAALAGGHAYVSHDWMSDPTGFKFLVIRLARENSTQNELNLEANMGDAVRLTPGTSLFSLFPVRCKIRLLRNGEVIQELHSEVLQHLIEKRGVYRIEARLPIAGEDRIWIYSNPIYVL